MEASTSTRCLCIEVRTAAQKLTRLYDDALTDAGITVTQLSQLNTIRTLDAPTVKRLAEATQLDRSTLGRNLKLMERQGLVSMTPGADARTRVVRLTPRGTEALKRGGPEWYKVQSRLLEKLGPEKRTLLQQLLNELTSTEALTHD